MMHRALIPTMWLLWVIYWKAAAANTKHAVRQESFGSRAIHIGALAVAIVLLSVPSIPILALDRHFVPRGATEFWIGAAITAIGLLFSIWARGYLGANWSGAVTIKDRHALVCNGPYAWARHPIYTGLLLAFAGSAIALGQWRDILAVIVVAAALWRKLKIEEKWLAQEFGAAYFDYQKKVAALIPFVI